LRTTRRILSALQAHGYARTRRSHSRRNFRLTAQDWHMVEVLLMKEDWSPEQIAGRLDLEGRLQICHETIYRHVWNDKRHGTYDSRGRLAGKRPIEQRPAAADDRSRVGHWEATPCSATASPASSPSWNARPDTSRSVRQYLPKRQSMASLTQHECNAIAQKLNRRPRKRLGYRTPEECYHP